MFKPICCTWMKNHLEGLEDYLLLEEVGPYSSPGIIPNNTVI